MINREGLMRCDVRRAFKADAPTMGYLYFTDNINEAAYWALGTYLCDLTPTPL